MAGLLQSYSPGFKRVFPMIPSEGPARPRGVKLMPDNRNLTNLHSQLRSRCGPAVPEYLAFILSPKGSQS
jgi:hypothetical protein